MRCADDRVRTATLTRHLPPGSWVSGGALPQLGSRYGDIPPAVFTAAFFSEGRGLLDLPSGGCSGQRAC
jgi:hypothetical protein